MEYGIGIVFDYYSIPTLKCKLNLVCYTSSWTPGWIRGFIEGSDGRYWIGTAGSDTAYFDGNRWVRVPIVGGGEISFFEDDDHDLWAVGSGIFKWQESNQQWLEVTGDETRGAKFRTPKISADGTWRLMSDGEPIFASFDGKKLSIHPSSDQPDISYRNIHDDGFVEYPAGVFWLATDRGLRRIEGDTWYDLTVADGLPSNSIWCVMADDQGYLWIGTEKETTD